MRTINSAKNILTGVVGQILTYVLQFISRTVFIYMLGAEYLGISGLFVNVLTILSITELGIGTAIAYSLYKPLADKDIRIIQATMNLFRKAYFIIGCAIFALGFAMMPFLPYIMKGTTKLININLIFALYLFQSVSSYWFFAYKSALLQADQKKFIINLIRYAVTIATTCLQIVLLIVFKSFLLYTIVSITSNILSNILSARKADKIYPYIKNRNNEILSKESKKAIYKNIFGMSIYKLNAVILRSTDNIVISIFIGVVAVGLYSNYLIITSALIMIAKLIFSSVTSSIGNLFVSESKQKNEFIFRCLSFMSYWIYGFCAVCLWILFNPFITLWVGDTFLLDNFVVLIIVLDFAMEGFQSVSLTFKDACGLFWQGKYRPLATAVLNIVISIILAPRAGIAGVLLGTIISRLLTTWWFEPWLVYKYAFNMSPKKYFIKYFAAFAVFIFAAALTKLSSIPFSSGSILNFAIQLIFCMIIPNLIFFILYRKSMEFKYLLNLFKQLKAAFQLKLKKS